MLSEHKGDGLFCFLFGSTGGRSNESIVHNVFTNVKGGITDTSAGVMALRNPDIYQKWGASLKYNPTVIDFEVTQ